MSTTHTNQSAKRLSVNVPFRSALDAWNLHQYVLIDSTNLVAADMPVWHAVCADMQTAGRGRFQRNWISDQGGLWLSAVVPAISNPADWRALPLAAGLAVCDTLRKLGTIPLRVRWPNDVLADNRKLAGLLIEQFHPDRAVIGVGVNVFNHPESADAALAGQIVRLAGLVANAPPLIELSRSLLRNIKSVVEIMQNGGFKALLPRVNELWGEPREVELDLDGEIRVGIFRGVSADGSLLLRDSAGTISTYAAHEVRHLRELSIYHETSVSHSYDG